VTIAYSVVANDLVITATDIPRQDLTNFLLAIPFTADSTHMEDRTRTGNNVI
jgi:hypothetical protein